IKNYADIYFDYNAAVQTNNTLNTIDYRLNTESHTSNEMVKSIYPNPSNGTVFVQLNDVARSPVSVRVVDFCGRIVALRDFDQGTSILRLDTHHLQSGIYFVEVTSGQAAKSIKKLILLHD
ncbi:MAG TPA: T9SS type A sorting domain-containing protein, partial [Saprospiraceae bacterium]|nr:T9SS type A sorting domain-containing protein [Saprospiraceae bacterium]